FGFLYEQSVTGNYLLLLGLQQGGSATMLASVVVAGVTSGNLRLDLLGTSLKLYLNGNLMASATDAGLTGAGAVGILDIHGGTAFSDFAAYSLGQPAPAVFSDSFARADSSTLGSAWSVAPANSFGISGQQAAAAA